MSTNFHAKPLFSVTSFVVVIAMCTTARCQEKLAASPPIQFGPYEYESKPDDPAFAKFFPRKAPERGPMLLRKGDRLAIVGDSITEQKKYSRIIETYLTVCHPELEITARQYGWSGEKTDGFLRRMEKDCLRFNPTITTLSYGMNDARYRPFDVTNGEWYRDHYTAIVRKLKSSGSRVVLGSPGCSGKIASWVKSRSGTLDEHNLSLCALRDIGIGIAQREQVRFADVFWPMYQAQVFASRKYAADRDEPYYVAGEDGIHPGWAGHVMMAFAYLNAMGIDGDLGTIVIDASTGRATASDGHHIDDSIAGETSATTITSTRYPFCATGPIDDDNSIRSGMTLVPFHETLNRFTLKVDGLTSERARVMWGEFSSEFDSSRLKEGILLAKEFPKNPFSAAFERVDEAVTAKQTFETHQIKRVFHGKEGKADFDAAVEKTEAERAPLAKAIADAMQPVTHAIRVEMIQ
jgi:lysophospholipase L1-like esterase